LFSRNPLVFYVSRLSVHLTSRICCHRLDSVGLFIWEQSALSYQTCVLHLGGLAVSNMLMRPSNSFGSKHACNDTRRTNIISRCSESIRCFRIAIPVSWLCVPGSVQGPAAWVIYKIFPSVRSYLTRDHFVLEGFRSFADI